MTVADAKSAVAPGFTAATKVARAGPSASSKAFHGSAVSMGSKSNAANSAVTGGTEEHGSPTDMRVKVTKIMIFLLIFAMVVQVLFFGHFFKSAIFSIPGGFPQPLNWAFLCLYITMAVIRAGLFYLFLVALASLYYSLCFWYTWKVPATRYSSWLVSMDPKTAIKFLVVNGFWLLVAIFFLRCIESLALACDDYDHAKRSSNVHAWLRVSCIDSSASHSFTVLSILVADFVINAAVCGIELMLLLCLYGYSMAMAASDQRWSGLHRSLSEPSLAPDAMKHRSCMRPLKPALMPPPALPTSAQQPPQEPPGITPQQPGTAPAPPEKTPATSALPVQPKRSSAAVKDKRARRRDGRHGDKHKNRKLTFSSVVQHTPPPVRRTVTRIKAGFQYIRGRSAQLGRTPIMGPVVKIGRFLGSPTQRASPTREDAAHGGRKTTQALTQGTMPTSTPAGREQFFKTPYVDLHAKFETAPDAVVRDDRAEASVAAERMTRGIATHASEREMVKESKPSETAVRAQLFKTRDLDLKATFEDAQPASPVGTKRGVTPATTTKWQNQQVIWREQIQEPTRGTSEPGQLANQGAMARQEEARGQKRDEEEFKPYVQIRAVFEPLLREKHPEKLATAATVKGGPAQTGTMRSRSTYVHGIAAQVERQLQQHMQSPHFVNITAGIHRPGASEQRRTGFYCLHPSSSGGRMAIGSLPPLPPLSDEAHGSVGVAPTRATACRPQPELMLPPHLPQARTAATARQETLGRSTEDKVGQQRLSPRLDPRLKALQSVLIKASFTPRVPDKTVPAAQDGPAMLPSTGGAFGGIADDTPPSSPPPPSVPPPPPPLPPPPSNPRRRIEPFFFKFAGSVGADDMPTCIIGGGITQSLTRLVDKKPQQPQQSVSAAYLGKPSDELPKSVEGLPKDADDLPKDPRELPKIPPELTQTVQTQAGADSPEAPPAPPVTPANFSKPEKDLEKTPIGPPQTVENQLNAPPNLSPRAQPGMSPGPPVAKEDPPDAAGPN